MKRIIKKEKKCRVGYWFYPLAVDWIEADQLNVSLQSIVGKGWDLTELLEKSCITEKSLSFHQKTEL